MLSRQVNPFGGESGAHQHKSPADYKTPFFTRDVNPIKPFLKSDMRPFGEGGSFDSRLTLRYSFIMQTMIQLDDALLAQATKLAHEKGYDLSHLIEETLRDKIAPAPLVAPKPFLRLTTVGGQGVRPGVDLNNSARLLAAMEQGA